MKVVYGSVYGHSKKYAEHFANEFNIEPISYRKLNQMEKVDLLVYFGGLYAGGVKGLSAVNRKYNKLVLVTVGLADPLNEENTERIKKSIKSKYKDFNDSNIKLFHLRGGIDYDKLLMHHRLMMRLVYTKAKNISLDKQNDEIKTMIKTYGSKVDFLNFESLNPIFQYVKNIRNK